MSIAWTEEQRKVIDLRDRNILVSAAAGSGKTAVLVERIIAMLTDAKHPVSVDSLLIVTFTEAAAAEMKDRIREAIEKKLEADDTNEHLKTQATLIHSAQITTIHSFCLSVIRDHFHAIDIDPGFRVGEEGELKLMKHDVLGQILEDRYQNGSREFLEFVEAYGGGRDDRKMEELVLKLYEYSRSYPDAEGWLASCVDAYDIKDEAELEGSRCMELIRKQSMLYMSDAAALIDEALDVCREPDGPSVYEEALLSDREIVNTFLAAGSYGQMYEAAADVRWTKLKANRDKTVSEEKAALVKAAREEVKKTVNDLCSQYLCQDAEGAVEDMTLCRRAMSVLASLVDEFACRFEERKRDQNMIDFSDMEQYALRILAAKEGSDFVPTAVAREYQQRFQEIMIDEYQDSNLIQETILTSVSTVSQGRNNVFMVGDVKQSIYRFRLSRPELFMEKFHTYDTGNSSRQRIDLHKNFRSRKEVLDSVNDIFEQIMTPALGGIMYDDEAALHIGAGFEESSEKGQNDTEVLLIDTDPALYVDDMDTEKKAIMPSDRELEARAIAARIRKLLENQTVLDKASGKSRKARYSDIVILTRSVKGFSDVFSEVLNKEGIPTYAGTKEGYFETQEIGVLLDYLRVLNNRKQDIPLAAVLKSPFLGLSDVEMADIKNRAVDLPFHEAVPAYASQEETPAGCRLKECLDKMEQFRKKVPYTPIHELLLLVLKETGYEEYVTAMPGGEQRKANLQMLIEKARAFESTSYKGLFHFIRYIEQLQKYDVDYGEASLEDEQSDTVRIMTIHKSKGLEFPIVFVSGMGKQFNMTDARSSVVLHARLGAGLDAVDTDMRTKSPSLLKRVIQKEEMQDSLGEELRVLYVALTRAKEKLIMTGTVKNAGRKLDSYALAARRKEQQLSFTRLVRAGSYLDWILPAVLRKSEDIPVNIERISAEDLVRESAGEYVKGRLTAEVLRRWDTGQVYDLQMKELIEEQFSYEYPYSLSQNQKLKFTVSELKKRAYMEEEAGAILYEEEDVVPLIPQFLKEEEELSGASRGTAYHRLLELLDFAEDYDGVLLKEAMERLRSEGKLTQDMADCIRPGDILRFLDSSAGRRMRNASVKQKLYKEQPFVLGVDAREMYPDEAEGELILVQGIIDVYFEEEDGLVVLDYKTDKAKSGVELREKYHAQLDYYARALEQVTGKHVKEKIIYSFTLQEEIEV
ncbi:helicase-exonuclease AddAB subunit AddA [Dorea sp. D27]|uniref:helicase-exonuclease AddAB subunit AddA n=1 Tax=Dorea sp. D27 TaxID=658665 RepID=UPI000673ACC5|nr:helicase-exonuclease AddAB subunit AddA [Dorea sp. D27]KMZ52482.1 ATP-dependent nuclease subunit A [Dorea sp. D27]